MAKAKVSQFIGATRTVLVPLTFEEGGERKTEDFKVVYRAFSPRVARDMEQLEQTATDNLPRVLAGIIVSIPEISTDGNGSEQPIEITSENLEQMSTDNLLAIYRGVLKDVNPTKAPKTSSVSPSSSETAGAAQS